MNNRRNCFVVAICTVFCLPQFCLGVSGVPEHGHTLPWFTGPLLTPTARVLSEGQVNLEPYLFYTVNTGKYGNNWKPVATPKFYQINPQLQVKVGVAKNLDLSISLQSSCSWTQGRVGSAFGDLPVGFDYQLYHGEEDSWLTFAKFSFQEILPTGKYQRLSPHKLGTDIGGAGTFGSQVGLGFSKLVKFCDGRYMNSRCFFSATFSTPVHVHGLNAYGGDPGTRGTVRPGVDFAFLAGTEYMLTANWVLACDIQIAYSNKTSFKGSSVTPVSSPSSAQFSIAPAIEYNWDESIGLIVGPWFTVAGRNSPQFYGLVAALNYVY